jgi:hypothetical protein
VTSHGRKFGQRDSHPIPIWNGIFEHFGRIGAALWEFEWCIDKITKERNGVGIVLGGKPVKLEEITRDLKGSHKETVRLHLRSLEREKYIRRKKTPYGYVIEVLNSRKFGIWKLSAEKKKSEAEKPENRASQSLEKPENQVAETRFSRLRNQKKGVYKEDAAEDSAVDAAVGGAPTAWLAIGTDRLGVPRFRARWEFSFANRNGDSISAAMERCIVSCQDSRIPIPKPFYDAKRKIERKEEQPWTKPETSGRLDYLPALPPLPCKG